MAYNSSGQDILFGKCKYTNEPMDVDVFYALWEKEKVVAWIKDRCRDNFIFFSINGYIEQMQALANSRNDVLLCKRKNRFGREIFVVKQKKDQLWAEAKRRCHLSNEALEMAKEMGLNPKSLIKNIPSPKQQWKAPVDVWIRDMYEQRQKKARAKAGKREKNNGTT